MALLDDFVLFALITYYLLLLITHGMTYTHALIPSSPFTHIYISGVGAVKIRSPLFPHAHAGFAESVYSCRLIFIL